jgi:type I restriction enzyme M protein
MAPKPGQVIGDPACGTGGFLLAAHDYISQHNKLSKPEMKHLRTQALRGTDIVPGVVSLCAMNLYLHGIGSTADANDPPVDRADALAQPSGRKFDMILANPPFGKKGGYTIVGDDGKISTECPSALAHHQKRSHTAWPTASRQKQEYERDELRRCRYARLPSVRNRGRYRGRAFWATTSNKQLNFLQHIVSELKIGGTAAVVLPDNVLFEGGAGETIRRELLKRCNVHTLLRLPTGIFYAQGVKANVLFFERKAASETPWTKDLWIYDLRTNQHFTLKTNPLANKDLDDFKAVYHPGAFTKRQETDRYKRFTYEEIVARDKANLDILWLKDDSLEDSDNLPAPAVLAAEIVESLEAALAEFRAVEEALVIES